ncbi:MAG: bifunctional demethylmenaquinone methyltransferase/2-methoxy-6-polyprenyl-1,4-benzoquinol methylase UbiE [Alphaproteobacteria bacterium]|nr:bifunctional demethylmenaquinone methyltransferase/2-methoxy-6-polyprenyl-1,4-benzoquinol methylase UbiE [Alphaproteobacteria bacterium]
MADLKDRINSPGDGQDAEADFGYRRVPASARDGLVRGVFDSVARRYDLMNDLMSGGIHRLWKAALIDMVGPRPGMHLLDVAGGTGDVAFRFLDRVQGDARVTVCDINPSMLSVGRDRALDRGIAQGVEWVCGTAEALPLPDMSVDAYTIAFGLRNVTNIDRALAEARRVLKPGGRFFCLEFSRVAVPFLGELYDRYSFNVVPLIGEVVTGDRAAYRYLVESIRKFPPQDALARRVEAAGLDRVAWRNLSGGIAAIHSGWRL